MITARPDETFQALQERLATISDVYSASVLAWDRQTYMPEGGVRGRAEQLASLARLAHEMLVSPETGELLERAGEREPGSDAAALLRLAGREYDRASRLPARLVAETSRATALAEPAWIQARESSDWARFAPHIERVLELKQEEASHLDGEHPYDAMLDRYEPGASTRRLRGTFAALKSGIVPLVRDVSARTAPRRSGASSTGLPRRNSDATLSPASATTGAGAARTGRSTLSASTSAVQVT